VAVTFEAATTLRLPRCTTLNYDPYLAIRTPSGVFSSRLLSCSSPASPLMPTIGPTSTTPLEPRQEIGAKRAF